MTDLQMGLIALGGVTVAGVFAYNKWQERAHRKVAEQVFEKPEQDVLLGDKAPPTFQEPSLAPEHSEMPSSRLEPGFSMLPDETIAPRPLPEMPAYHEVSPDSFANRGSGHYEEVNTREDEVREVPDDDFPIRPEKAPGPVPAILLNPKVDCIAVLEMVDFVPAIQILHSQRESTAPISKPILWVGFNENTRQWEFFPEGGGGEYRRIRMALQLVNRRGAASESDLALFGNAVQRLSDELMAVADMPSSQSMLEQARAMDAFCADVDLQIGVNLISKGAAFAGTKVRGLAEAAGMVLGSDGAFTRCDDEGHVLFSVVNFETMPFAAETLRTMSTHGITFLLDVPRVHHGERNFAHMIDLAKRFADALNGTLVDDNRHPLTDAQLEQIRREYVGKPQALMAAQGIPPGSPLALRLFA